METWVIATTLVAIYLLITVGVGALASRKLTINVEDFFLAGRKTGFIVLYLTVVATYHSAFAFLGSGGFFYTHGIGFWEAGTWTVVMGAITYVLGTRIWALGKKFDYVTPADLLADFYESEAVRVVSGRLGAVHHPLHPGPGTGARLHHPGRDRRPDILRGRHAHSAWCVRLVPDRRRPARGLLDRRRAGWLDVRRRLGRSPGPRLRAVRRDLPPCGRTWRRRDPTCSRCRGRRDSSPRACGWA